MRRVRMGSFPLQRGLLIYSSPLGVRIHSNILNYTLFFIFLFPVPPPPDLNTSLNCSLCNPSNYAYPYHEGYMVLVYRQHTPKGLRTTSRNS